MKRSANVLSNWLSRIPLTIVITAFCLNTLGFPAPKSFRPAGAAHTAIFHGTDTYIYLFNTRAYRTKVLPAYQAYRQKNDLKLLLGLLREARVMVEKNPKLSDLIMVDDESYEKAVGVLEGKIPYQPVLDRYSGKKEISAKERKLEYIQFELGGSLLQAFCLPRDKGVNPEQNVSGVPLIHYLDKHSDWMDGFFDGMGHTHGVDLQLAMADSLPEMFLKKDVEKFSAELSKIPEPDDRYVKEDFDNLRAIVRLALNDPDLTLLVAII